MRDQCVSISEIHPVRAVSDMIYPRLESLSDIEVRLMSLLPGIRALV